MGLDSFMGHPEREKVGLGGRDAQSSTEYSVQAYGLFQNNTRLVLFVGSLIIFIITS